MLAVARAARCFERCRFDLLSRKTVHTGRVLLVLLQNPFRMHCSDWVTAACGRAFEFG